MMLQIPAQIKVPSYMRLFISLPIALILSERLSTEYASQKVTIGMEDLLLGLGIGAFVSLFFSTAMKISLFFAPIGNCEESIVENENDPWRQIVDSFFFLFLIVVFMALRIERNLLEVLTLTIKIPKEKLFSLEIWGVLLTDLSWLALKMSSFGFVLVLTQKMFEEVYRRLGGESLKIVFSVCSWLAILVMAPVIIPSFGAFIGKEIAEFWKHWLGVSL